jgi:hypothetical protein
VIIQWSWGKLTDNTGNIKNNYLVAVQDHIGKRCAIILANVCAFMFFAHGERQLSNSFAMVMGKPHDDIFGHVCIYRRNDQINNCYQFICRYLQNTIDLIKSHNLPYSNSSSSMGRPSS